MRHSTNNNGPDAAAIADELESIVNRLFDIEDREELLLVASALTQLMANDAEWLENGTVSEDTLRLLCSDLALGADGDALAETDQRVLTQVGRNRPNNRTGRPSMSPLHAVLEGWRRVLLVPEAAPHPLSTPSVGANSLLVGSLSLEEGWLPPWVGASAKLVIDNTDGSAVIAMDTRRSEDQRALRVYVVADDGQQRTALLTKQCPARELSGLAFQRDVNAVDIAFVVDETISS